MKRLFLIVLFVGLLFGMSAEAARVDTVMVHSASMNKKVQVIYVVPDCALGIGAKSCPVIYLLHGYSGGAGDWLGHKPELRRIADAKGIVFVCPDGKNSWYWDSPKNSSSRYETFISKELVAYTDAHYKTRAVRTGRAITGLSMGGHGALWNAIRHKDMFGAAGSMSGGVDIRPFSGKWEIANLLGERSANPAAWESHTVMNAVENLHNGELALIFDCGEADFFQEVNRELHHRLLSRKVDHDFITRPGTHSWAYWVNSLDYQILFFEKFFAASL